jgi:acetoin utilization protein AcuB
MQAPAEIMSLETVTWPRTIGEVMTRHPVAVRADQPLAAAHAIMRSLGVRHLPVLDHDRVVGVVSQGDLRLLESLDRIDVAQVAVEEAMTHNPLLVDPDQSLASVLGAMMNRHIGAVMVAERGRLVGIFTAFDAVATLRRLLGSHES